MSGRLSEGLSRFVWVVFLLTGLGSHFGIGQLS